MRPCSSSPEKITLFQHRRVATTRIFLRFSSCLLETPRIRRTGIRSLGRRIFVTTVTLRRACKTYGMCISAAVFPSSEDDDGLHASVYRADDEPGEGGKDDLDACPQGARYTCISIYECNNARPYRCRRHCRSRARYARLCQNAK